MINRQKIILHLFSLSLLIFRFLQQPTQVLLNTKILLKTNSRTVNGKEIKSATEQYYLEESDGKFAENYIISILSLYFWNFIYSARTLNKTVLFNDNENNHYSVQTEFKRWKIFSFSVENFVPPTRTVCVVCLCLRVGVPYKPKRKVRRCRANDNFNGTFPLILFNSPAHTLHTHRKFEPKSFLFLSNTMQIDM